MSSLGRLVISNSSLHPCRTTAIDMFKQSCESLRVEDMLRSLGGECSYSFYKGREQAPESSHSIPSSFSKL